MSSKLREALNQLLGLIDNGILVFSNELDPSEVSNAQYQIDKADEALAEPVLNCEVGTADEQIVRFDSECQAIRSHNTVEPCAGCPLSEHGEGTEDCQLKWSQMPYGGEVEKNKIIT